MTVMNEISTSKSYRNIPVQVDNGNCHAGSQDQLARTEFYGLLREFGATNARYTAPVCKIPFFLCSGMIAN
jgi:hypothetical protein